MIAVFETNVVLDVLLARPKFLADSAAAFSRVELGEHRGLVCADAITTIHYIARRELGTRDSLEKLRDLLKIFGVSQVSETVIASALSSGFTDFEDAVLHESAKASRADCIVTRNIRDFRTSTVSVYTPSQFLIAT